MARLAILLVLLSSGCDDDAPAQPDAGCPQGGPCATRGLECTANGETCFCDGTWWHCRSTLCPPPGQVSGSCQAGLSCDYDFEFACACIAPENRWRCCGGVNLCPRDPVEGQLCCGLPLTPIPGQECPSACVNGRRRLCLCERDHMRCTEEACPDGGA